MNNLDFLSTEINISENTKLNNGYKYNNLLNTIHKNNNNNDTNLTEQTPINICFCSDENLIEHIPTVINSIYNTNKYPIHFYYVHNISNEKKLMELENYIRSFPNYTFSSHFKKWDHDYKGLKHITEATMLRLYIPETLPCKKLLYLDIDIIVNTNLKNIYSLDCGPDGIIMRQNYPRAKNELNYISGNCGIMMMDLDTLRKNNFTRFAMNLVINKKNNEFLHDQNIINRYCMGNFVPLDIKYNIYICFERNIMLEQTDFILHYVTGKYKPYQNYGKEHQYLWNKFVDFKPDKPRKLNLGILVYNNSYAPKASRNLGDQIQSLAAINAYKKIVEYHNKTEYTIEKFLNDVLKNNVPNFNFIFIKRDNLHDMEQYKNEKNIVTLMMGWWMHPYNKNGDISFNIPECIIPIFTSFHINSDKLLKKPHIETLRKYEPIGCRDHKTQENLNKKGIATYFSACLTLTIDFYKWHKKNKKTYYVDTLDQYEGKYITHHYLPNAHYGKALKNALQLLKDYSKCQKVITSRLHCYLPCIAMGTPVTFVAPDGNPDKTTWGPKDRFYGLIGRSEREYTKLKQILMEDVLDKLKLFLKYEFEI